MKRNAGREEFVNELERIYKFGRGLNGVAIEQYEQVFRAEPSSSHKSNIWGCNGFDAVTDRSGLRVRALFPLINEQKKEMTTKLFHLLITEHKDSLLNYSSSAL